jgi:DNA topoisomerase-1
MPPSSVSADLAVPAVAAASADLSYVTDDAPGIRRRRSGKGFTYIGPDGRRIDDPATLARIRSLAVPPAYTDVWICPDPSGHIQATGRDARGRKQYRYHPGWAEVRDAAKYDGLVAFGRALPRLRRRIAADVGRRGLQRERVVAAVAWLLDNALVRVGNPAYARDNKSFGLTTLRSRHADVEGTRVLFRFKGKSGREWRLKLADRRIARVVRSCQELPGQILFQYEADGARRAVTSDDVNAYLREIGGAALSSKHFRTWAATVIAAERLAALPPPETKRAAARAMNAALDRVAARLGNTRAVCRRCYVHPLVLDRYAAGTLASELAAAARAARRKPAELEPGERRVLAWLEREEGLRPPTGRSRGA